MDSVVTNLFNFLFDIPSVVAQFGKWLFSPIGNGIDLPPIAIFGIAGFTFIFALHVIHLVNPLG